MSRKFIKRTILSLLILTIISLIWSNYNEIKLYRYIKSDKFINDQYLVQTSLIDFERIFYSKPSTFNNFTKFLDNNIQEDAPYQLSENFYSYDLSFEIKNSQFLIVINNTNNEDRKDFIYSKDLNILDILNLNRRIVINSLPIKNLSCRDHKNIYIIKDSLPIYNESVSNEIKSFLKKYSLKIIEELNLTNNKYMYLELKTENIELTVLCDSTDFLNKNPEVLLELKQYFKSRMDLSLYDYLYFPLYIYPKLIPPASASL